MEHSQLSPAAANGARWLQLTGVAGSRFCSASHAFSTCRSVYSGGHNVHNTTFALEIRSELEICELTRNVACSNDNLFRSWIRLIACNRVRHIAHYLLPLQHCRVEPSREWSLRESSLPSFQPYRDMVEWGSSDRLLKLEPFMSRAPASMPRRNPEPTADTLLRNASVAHS